MEELSATLNQLRFEGSPSNADDAYLIGPDGIEGYFESTSMRGHGEDRPLGHGSFDVPVFQTGRTIQWSGHVLSSSGFVAAKKRDLLTGVLAEGQSARLEVSNDAGPTWATVRLVAVRPAATYGKRIPYLIQLLAADPRRYGPQAEDFVGSSVEVFHFGNVTASPVITVTGSMPSGYSVLGPEGREYVVTQALTSGHEHRIVMRTGFLYRDGVLQRGAVSRAETWGAPPGQLTAIDLAPVSGSGSMSVEVPATYM